MTPFVEMKERALAEFDQMVADREREVRARMRARGRTPFEIDVYVEACLRNVAKQRTTVGRIVTVEMMKVGVPLGATDDRA